MTEENQDSTTYEKLIEVQRLLKSIETNLSGKEAELDSLRRTIYGNAQYSRPNPPEGDVSAAQLLALARSYIVTLEDKLDAVMKESKYSGPVRSTRAGPGIPVHSLLAQISVYFANHENIDEMVIKDTFSPPDS